MDFPLLSGKTDVYAGNWGFLPGEPCRYCHATGAIMFLIDEGPEGMSDQQPVRCEKCKRTWSAGEPMA